MMKTVDPPRTANAEELARVLRILHPPGSTVELRSFGVDGRPKKTVAGYYRDFDKAAADAVALEKRKPSAIYLVMNQVPPELFGRSPDRLTDFPEHTTADKDIARRHWLLIDVDPERAAGLSSTDQELAAAEQLAANVRDWLTDRMGWHEPIEAMSGNGWHLLFPVNLPNDSATATMLQSILEAVQTQAVELSPDDQPACKVDLKVFNASRITKFYGTLTRKGFDTPERPHRRSHLHHVPEDLGDWEHRPTVDLELFRAVAELAPQAEPKPNTNGAHGSSRRLMVDAYLRDAGVEFRHETTKDGGDKFIINPCPFNPDHKGKDAAIFRSREGRLTFHCFHDGCNGRTWHDIKREFGEPRPEHWDPPKGEWQRQQQGETGSQQKDSPAIRPVFIEDLIAKHQKKMREPIIEGLLRSGETCNLIAAPKVGKSWMTYGLALSIVTGGKWLDRFWCRRGKVLIIDNELHEETEACRIEDVADAMEIRLTDHPRSLAVITLRGELMDLIAIGGRILAHISPGMFDAVIVDAWYRVLGDDENANGALKNAYNLVDRFAKQTGAAWILVHHSTKGSQADKRVTDVGAGGGSQSRAADSHIVLREHEEPDVAVLEAAVRSFPPTEPLPLRWTFPVWTPAEELDPTALKRHRSDGERKQEDRDREGRETILGVLQIGPETRTQLRTKAGMGLDRLNRLICQLIRSGDIQEIKIGEQDTLQIVTRSAGPDL